jgi:peptide/nickel transport system permease protein
MSRYLIQRIFRGLLTIFISVSLTFFIVRAMPSDPVSLMVSPQMTKEAQQAMIEAYGLNQPLHTQYGKFLGLLAQGNLGTSFSKHIPVSQYIFDRLPWTLLLLAGVMVLVLCIGIPIGIFAAKNKGKTSDRVISVIVTMCISVFIPFVSFLLLYVFAFRLKALPTGGAYNPPQAAGLAYILDVAKHMILPTVALTITNLANAVLYTRNSMIDVLSEDYIRTAYSKGSDKKRVIRVHALKNAMIPTVTVIGLQIGTMVGGAVVTESVFSWPGVGRMIFEAVNSLDYPVLQGAFLMLAIAVVVMNFLTDLVIAWLDPRIMLGGK